MQKFRLFLSVVLMLLQASRSYSSDEEQVAKRQSANPNFYPYQFNPYSWRPWNFPYFYQYQPEARIPQKDEEVDIVESGRQYYPGYPSCRSHSTGEKGNCFDPATCTASGGRASGTCINGNVCCINVVTNICHHSHGGARSSETTSINNTYWQSSLRPIKASSSCTLTVKLDNRYPDPYNPAPAHPPPFYGISVCQVRLDFLVFSISQPDSESICSGDYFEVVGAINTVPNICGFNDAQHMYLHVPPSDTTPTDLQLTFNFGSSDIEIRAWNILISMIPCGSPKLAPSDCLQYFTARSGSVKSFNWRDVAGTATRQLANQDYSICFRSTPASLQRQLCLTPCTVLTTQKPFSISTPSAISTANVTGTMTPDVSQWGSLNCNNDFLVIPGGFNVGNPAPVLNMAFDRYCGERLNALPGSANSTTVCTTATPFRMLYRTNRDETLTSPTSPTIDSAFSSISANGNRGFCLSFRVQQ